MIFPDHSRAPAPRHAPSALAGALSALRAALPVLRARLRDLVELGCLGAATHVNRFVPPQPHSMADCLRADAEACLAAIHETRRALRDAGEIPEPDDQPEWLDRVIDGEIPL